ncbi:MAG: rhomboid family intramembrane serine protease [Actinophytocola sp.]|uniref:rhomboid family intramembrane serine protease n=1 Tax=Actinophytocola sp. TaxID=1872138 RepID=UPI003D6C3A56
MRVPVLTAGAVGVAVVAAVVQYAVPAAVPTLQRDPGGLPAGEWWRLLTPLLVQTLGWYHVVTNLVTLALVGAVAERQLGRWRWAILFAVGTVAGQVAAYAWHEPGGGYSIAVCGLAGGVVGWSLSDPPNASRWTVTVVGCYVAALSGLGVGGIWGALAMVTVAALVLPHVPVVAGLGASSGLATVLALDADLHGVSLVAGVVTVLALAALHKRQVQ